MSRFVLVHTLAAQRKAREAERRIQAHCRDCRNCKAEKPCADRKTMEIEQAMHEATPVAQ